MEGVLRLSNRVKARAVSILDAKVSVAFIRALQEAMLERKRGGSSIGYSGKDCHPKPTKLQQNFNSRPQQRR